MAYSGIDKHIFLEEFVNSAEGAFSENRYYDLAFYSRKCLEYMVDQLACKYPEAKGENLYETIEKLAEARVLSEQQKENLHQARKNCNKYIHGSMRKGVRSKEAWKNISEYITYFLREVPEAYEDSKYYRGKYSRKYLEKEYDRTHNYKPGYWDDVSDYQGNLSNYQSNSSGGQNNDWYNPNIIPKPLTAAERKKMEELAAREQAIRDKMHAEFMKRRAREAFADKLINVLARIIVYGFFILIAAFFIYATYAKIRNSIETKASKKAEQESIAAYEEESIAESLAYALKWPEVKGTSEDGLFEIHAVGEQVTIIKYVGTEVNVVIPSDIAGRTQIILGDRAFAGSNIESIDLGDSVVEIADGHVGDAVFGNCKNLKTFTCGKGLKSLSAYTFVDCEALEEVNLPEGLERIEEFAFKNCKSLTDVTIPSTVRYFGGGVFTGSGVTEVTLDSECETNSQSYYYQGLTFEWK